MVAAGEEQVGRVLGRRYRLLAPVGAGASAVVFLADDVVLKRRVAVKLLHPSLAQDPMFLKRFRAEAHAAAALNHPNIMAVHDWGEEGGTPFLVTEYLGGGSLRSMLDRNRLLSPSQALLVALETARGLDYAHRRGLVHRDIKPANLLFSEDGRLRIADFGLARALAEAAWTEPSGVVLGTARYASPEQARGLAVDGKSDVYALALVLIESVTGQVPFASDTTVATLMNRVDKLMPVSADLGPLASVVERAGRPDPAERFSAAELGRALIQTAERLPRPAPLPLVPIAAVGSPGELGLVGGAAAAAVAAAPPFTEATAPEAPGPAVPVARTGDVTELAATGATTNGSGGAADGGQSGGGAFGGTGPAPVIYDERSPQERPRRRWRWLVALLATLLVAAAVAAGVVLYQRASETAYPVPPLVGVEIARARNIVSPYDWTVTERLGRNDEHAKGVVYEQEPASGELERGGEIVLYVSDGPFPAKLPDLVGKPQADAQRALTSAGLSVNSITPQFSETVPAGVVLAWTVGGRGLAPGTEVPKGTAVDLAVSRGPQPRTLPNLVGVPYAQAEAQLKQLGLAALRVPDVFNDNVVAGAVAGTNPAAGTQLAKGAPVAVAVSKGPDVVRVPNVVGMDLQTAVATLAQNGLGQGTISGPITGRVQATNPGPTTVVRRGTAVELILVP